MISIYTLEDFHVETEYLRREYQLNTILVSKLELESLSFKLTNVILLISQLGFYEKFIENFDGKITIFLVSDESLNFYNARFLKKVSFKVTIFRNYSYKKITFIKFLSSINWYIKVFNWSFINLLKNTTSLAKSSLKLFFIRYYMKNQKVIPLGYTNNFAFKYSKYFNISEDSSLIEFALSSKLKFKNRLLSDFYGSSNNLCRVTFLGIFTKKYNLRTFLSNSFMGSNGNEIENYFISLVKSRFSVVPQGAYNLETFRFYESLLCHCIPINPPISLHSPTFVDYYSYFEWNHKIDLDDALYNEKEKIMFYTLYGLKKSISAVVEYLKLFHH